MTCPTCQGRQHLPDLAPCGTCYATGAEPVYADAPLMAARLSCRAAFFVAVSEEPYASPAGRRSCLLEASEARAASIRLGAPNAVNDRSARIMALQLVSEGIDAEPFYKAVKGHLTPHGRAELVRITSLAAQHRNTEIARRIEVRLDA